MRAHPGDAMTLGNSRSAKDRNRVGKKCIPITSYGCIDATVAVKHRPLTLPNRADVENLPARRRWQHCCKWLLGNEIGEASAPSISAIRQVTVKLSTLHNAGELMGVVARRLLQIANVSFTHSAPHQLAGVRNNTYFRSLSMSSIKNTVRRFIREESGATMVEYGIMVALIAAVAIAVIKVVGNKVNNGFQNVNSAF